MPPVPLLAATHQTGGHPPSPLTVVVWLIVLALAYAGAYSVSVRRHPYRPCRKCGESGKHRGTVFTRSFRACTRCGGTGRELRPFAKDPGSGRS
jgi:DnaJ-class molecular chaperone